VCRCVALIDILLGKKRFVHFVRASREIKRWRIKPAELKYSEITPPPPGQTVSETENSFVE